MLVWKPMTLREATKLCGIDDETKIDCNKYSGAAVEEP